VDGIGLLKYLFQKLHSPTLLISLFFISKGISMQKDCQIFYLSQDEPTRTGPRQA